MLYLLCIVALLCAVYAEGVVEGDTSVPCLHVFASPADTDMFISNLDDVYVDSVRRMAPRLVEADCAAFDTLVERSAGTKAVLPRLVHSVPSDTPIGHVNSIKADTHAQISCTDPGMYTLLYYTY
ncbi:hypothetical protein KIPB_007108 [Kipferlia bialata]|uniref:Uncharacterized protein n=1 Tax=Kipferlia bialata TaxID=797122 RepID=A0A9K3CYQ7_9EUKA|nr:hypothetical protein KIPB_007108 [Kipferlia bialata]|eukprot:g7108.t1